MLTVTEQDSKSKAPPPPFSPVCWSRPLARLSKLLLYLLITMPFVCVCVCLLQIRDRIRGPGQRLGPADVPCAASAQDHLRHPR